MLFIYEIKINEGIKILKDKITLPDEFAKNLMSISASTMRGILYAKMKAVIGVEIVLPILDENTFTRKMPEGSKILN